MIEYIILIVALIAAIASIYIIYHTNALKKEQEQQKDAAQDVSGNTPEISRAYESDASGSDASGTDAWDLMNEFTPPFATDQIQSVDDYEYNMVFQNEGDRAMTKSTRDFLMSKYPMDWTVQPPSSSTFQEGLASFKESFTNQDIPSKNPYNAINGSSMTPPVYKDERDILATYVPKKPNELTTYDADDAKEIVDRIYAAKGLVADLKKTGDNTYTIMGTHKKDEFVYEDDSDASGAYASTGSHAVPSAGEGIFIVPATMDNYKTPDPFFTVNPTTKTRMGKWDYSSWTPGLERMFAPTEPQMNWY